MIIPSIDLMGGQAVQLIGGKQKVIEAGDPLPLAEKFARVGEIAVIDLDAALGTGSNSALIEKLIDVAPCRVGGGIRDLDSAKRWIERGARKVIIGTRADAGFLSQLPRERVIAALDAVHGEVVVEGWQTKTGRDVHSRLGELKDLVAGFLVTFVEREGRMQGIDLKEVSEIRQAAGSAELTVAGGVTTLQELAAIDRLNADAQVGMALYSGNLALGEAFLAPMAGEQNVTPIIFIERNGRFLYHANLPNEQIAQAVDSGQIELPEIGSLPVERLFLNSSRSAVVVTICERVSHRLLNQETSLQHELFSLGSLYNFVCSRKLDAPDASYTKRLFEDPELLSSKLLEETSELLQAKTQDEVCWEAADLLYFTLVKLAASDVSLSRVEAMLAARRNPICRRKGDAKSR